MTKIVDFTNTDLSPRNLEYGGRAGEKRGIIYNNEFWFLKFPKNSFGMNNIKGLSYVNSPLSEYIGSNIYKILGYDVHETILGTFFDGKKNKVVCACKDFIKDDPVQFIHRFHKKEDIEIIGFITSLLAFGKRELFIKKLEEFLAVSGTDVYGYLKTGDFSKLNEEFIIDNTLSIAGYKAVIAEHKASGQKMVILDSGKKPLLTQEDIKSQNVDKKLVDLSEKVKYKGVRVQDLTVTGRGTLNVYGQDVPYAKFEAHIAKAPISDIAGIIASVKTSDGSEKLALSLSEKKKYSHLITGEFFKGVNEGVKG